MDHRCWRNTEQVLTVQSRCCLGEVGICSGEQQGKLLQEPKARVCWLWLYKSGFELGTVGRNTLGSLEIQEQQIFYCIYQKYATKMFLEITGRFCNFQKPENLLQVTKAIKVQNLNANLVSALAPSFEKPPYHEREEKEGANTQAEVQKKKGLQLISQNRVISGQLAGQVALKECLIYSVYKANLIVNQSNNLIMWISELQGISYYRVPRRATFQLP
ncbi:hypothetical protein MJG53_015980 [Ovis ammon polii x Ovis aries]|uniref:Uncharacterized protein n=1 Tax=Ovis ammon polii x Ovis aries TaxID=2918886 RepID=A0ACB9UDF0_9CETA|nr:hypothetical protein MJT46_015665 [Ovis ammon polii x Ovis aries]KAI4564968.1 hypothetical protein MJG53_015980 [Ovis ammon polii x Ovis aries]